MYKQIRFFIGADNKTGEVNQKLACEIVGRQYKGFTVYPTLGMWEGKLENSIVIEVIEKPNGTELVAEGVAQSLREELEQDSILVTVNDLNHSYEIHR